MSDQKSWLSRIEDKSTGNIYLTSIYFIVQTITTVGFGDIVFDGTTV